MSEIDYYPLDTNYPEDALGGNAFLQNTILQAYGRRAGALMLAGGLSLGLSACEPGEQTLPVGAKTVEKVLSINGTQLVTGSCIEHLQTLQVGQNETVQPQHRCNAQPNELRGQTVEQVRRASGNGKTYTAVKTERNCDAPGVAFLGTLQHGDVIQKEGKNYRKVDENGKVIANEKYCVWSKT